MKATAILLILATLLGCAFSAPQVTVQNGFSILFSSPPISLLSSRSDWEIASATLADVTGDGTSEWVLLVWRRWRDWPIQRWSSLPSPIAGFHDTAGRSCHLILLDPLTGREVWAGSALPVPFLALAVRDVDGDGHNELIALEGNYATGPLGPATSIDVWHWNGFGFVLEGRFPTPITLFDEWGSR